MKAWSVTQINRYIKSMFVQDVLLSSLLVEGEVTNCKYHSAGHIYFTLKDSGGSLSCIMFAGNRRMLKFPMKDGDRVTVCGSVDVYERDGRYQLYAKEIRPAGAGELYERFLRLKAELEEMGMFDPSYKKPIPRYARTVGIVTAPGGAAVRDIQNIARRRNPFVRLILYPSLVQGDGAAESLVRGLEALDRAGVDVIIIGRGGGSYDDLQAFNEESVARAIFACGTPVISAVGHETDTTIDLCLRDAGDLRRGARDRYDDRGLYGGSARADAIGSRGAGRFRLQAVPFGCGGKTLTHHPGIQAEAAAGERAGCVPGETVPSPEPGSADPRRAEASDPSFRAPGKRNARAHPGQPRTLRGSGDKDPCGILRATEKGPDPPGSSDHPLCGG